MPQEDPMNEVIAGYLEVPGVLAAVLLSDQGLVINCAQESVREQELEVDAISALVIDTIAAAQSFGREADVGCLGTMAIDFEHLSLLLVPLEADVILALLALPGTFLK